MKRAVPHHPLAGIGGHKMPTEGKVGGLKRLGDDAKGPIKDEPNVKVWIDLLLLLDNVVSGSCLHKK